MNNVRRVLAQTSVSAANTLHPSTLATRLSFTLCSRQTPSKHITKAEVTFRNTIARPPRHNRGLYIHKHTTSAPRSALCYSGHCHHCVNGSIGSIIPSHGDILTAKQPASQMLLPIATSDLCVFRVKSHLTHLSMHCSVVFFFGLLLICFGCNFNRFHTHTHTHMRVGTHARQISALTPQPYLTITISLAVTISTT